MTHFTCSVAPLGQILYSVWNTGAGCWYFGLGNRSGFCGRCIGFIRQMLRAADGVHLAPKGRAEKLRFISKILDSF